MSDSSRRGVSYRPLVAADQALLWDLLHIALWNPPPAPLRPREVLQDPRVRIYAEHWGAPTDVGVVAEEVDARKPLGACWMRVVANSQGLGHAARGARRRSCLPALNAFCVRRNR